MGAVAKVVAGIGLATVGAFTPGGGWLVGIGVPAAVGGVAERLGARRPGRRA